MKMMICVAVLAVFFWTGTAVAENQGKAAGCVSYETYSGSGSCTETFYCPNRFQPGHRTDHFVTEIPSPPCPVQTHTVVTHEAPYYNPPLPPPPLMSRDGSARPWRPYHYSTRNPWFSFGW